MGSPSGSTVAGFLFDFTHTYREALVLAAGSPVLAACLLAALPKIVRPGRSR